MIHGWATCPCLCPLQNSWPSQMFIEWCAEGEKDECLIWNVLCINELHDLMRGPCPTLVRCWVAKTIHIIDNMSPDWFPLNQSCVWLRCDGIVWDFPHVCNGAWTVQRDMIRRDTMYDYVGHWGLWPCVMCSTVNSHTVLYLYKYCMYK